MAFAKGRPVPADCAFNAVIYARYSSDKQTENSIDLQLRNGRAYCEAKGLHVIGEYVDRALSGTNDQRPEFQRMIRDAKKQGFAFIVVYRFDRFARNRYDSAIYKKELESVGVRVLSTEESVGTGDEGMILESIYEAMAESYSRRLSRVVSQGMQETARKGLSTGGNLSYGFKTVDHTVIADENTAPAIRYCFEARAAKKRKKAIIDELHARGYRTKTGKQFTIHTITQILSNPAYKGVHNYMGIERHCPAIVSTELWERVQEVERQDKAAYGQKTENHLYALTGKIFCGYCGATVVGNSGTSSSGTKYAYYVCSEKKKNHFCNKKSEKKEPLERCVCRQAVSVLTDDNIQKIAQSVYRASEAASDAYKITEAEKLLASIEREIDDAAEALMKTDSPALIKRINEKVAQLENKQQTVQADLNQLQANRTLHITVSEIEAFLNDLRRGDLLDPTFCQRLIHTMVNRIYIFNDKIVIYYNTRYTQEVTYTEMLNDITASNIIQRSDSLAVSPPKKHAFV